MRVAVGGFQNETNSFSSIKGTYEVFEEADGWPGITIGDAVVEALCGYNIGMAGLLDEACSRDWEVVPLAWCGGGASGTVTEDAFERVSALLLQLLEEALPVDAVLLDLHGAMTAEHIDDGDGAFLRRVRDLVGAEIPIICSLDLHANVSKEMVDLADELLIYRTYPHLDMAETGRRAARRMNKLLSNGDKLKKAFRSIPFLIPLTRGCTLTEPAESVYEQLEKIEKRAGLHHLSFACGFSSSDVPHCGPSIVGYGTDQAVVDRAVKDLFEFVMERETQFSPSFWTVEQAVDYASRDVRTNRPLLLADIDDNAGAGESSDTTWLLEELVRKDVQGAALGVLCDPVSAEMAHKAGVGAKVTLDIGGGSGKPGHKPFVGPFEVLALSDGRIQSTGIYFAGGVLDLGKSALLTIGGTKVVVSSKREQAADQAMFTHFGIDPRECRVLVLKSSVHYRADFQPLASEIVEVVPPDFPELLPYRNLEPSTRVLPNGPKFADLEN